jgi:hypothetical protein
MGIVWGSWSQLLAGSHQAQFLNVIADIIPTLFASISLVILIILRQQGEVANGSAYQVQIPDSYDHTHIHGHVVVGFDQPSQHDVRVS